MHNERNRYHMKKKFIAVALASLMGLSGIALASCNPGSGTNTSSSEQYSITEGTDGLVYELNEAGDGYVLTESLTVETTITIPELYEGLPVREIGEAVFRYSTIDKLTLPKSLRKIGDEAFLGLTSDSEIEEINIPEGVEEIGERSFYWIPTVERITLPSTLKTIGNKAFGISSSLVKVVADENNPYFVTEKNVLYTKDKTELVFYPQALANTTYAMPNTVKKVRENALYGNTSLTSISLSSELEEVEKRGIAALSGITSLPLTKTKLKTIGDMAFSENSALTSVALPATVETMGTGVFSRCTNLATAIFRNKLEKLPDDTFLNCSFFTTISLQDGLKEIGERVFEGCNHMTKFTIPSTVTKIGKESFRACQSLKSIELPEGMTEIPEYAFANNKALTSFTFPSTLTTVGKSALTGCENLTTIDLSGTKVTSIADYAFMSCNAIETLKLPTTLRSIGAQAFENVHGLEELQLPAGLETIGKMAFTGYRDLKKVYIPSSVSSIGVNCFYSLNTEKTALTVCFEASSFTIESTNEDGKPTSVVGSDVTVKFGVTLDAYEKL